MNKVEETMNSLLMRRLSRVSNELLFYNERALNNISLGIDSREYDTKLIEASERAYTLAGMVY